LSVDANNAGTENPRRAISEVVRVFLLDRKIKEIAKMKSTNPRIPKVPSRATYSKKNSAKCEPVEVTRIYGIETIKIANQRVSEESSFPRTKSLRESGETKRLSAVSFSNSDVIIEEASIVTTKRPTPTMTFPRSQRSSV
jgi:hypothetical protein